jgi:hypothetical protein
VRLGDGVELGVMTAVALGGTVGVGGVVGCAASLAAADVACASGGGDMLMVSHPDQAKLKKSRVARARFRFMG